MTSRVPDCSGLFCLSVMRLYAQQLTGQSTQEGNTCWVDSRVGLRVWVQDAVADPGGVDAPLNQPPRQPSSHLLPLVMFSLVSFCAPERGYALCHVPSGGGYACCHVPLGGDYTWSHVPSGGGYAWSHVISGVSVCQVHSLPPGRYTPESITPPVLTSSGGRRSRRYGSYRNTADLENDAALDLPNECCELHRFVNHKSLESSALSETHLNVVICWGKEEMEPTHIDGCIYSHWRSLDARNVPYLRNCGDFFFCAVLFYWWLVRATYVVYGFHRCVSVHGEKGIGSTLHA